MSRNLMVTRYFHALLLEIKVQGSLETIWETLQQLGELLEARNQPGTLGLWDLSCVYFHAFLAQLTWQLSTKGYLTSLLDLGEHD